MILYSVQTTYLSFVFIKIGMWTTKMFADYVLAPDVTLEYQMIKTIIILKVIYNNALMNKKLED